MYHSVHFAKRT